jgi:ribosomal protein S21
MTSVMVIDGDIERAIKKLQRWFNANLKRELHNRQGFETTRQRRKRKDLSAKRRKKKAERRLMEFKHKTK